MRKPTYEPPQFEVADVFRKFGHRFLETYSCSDDQYTVLSMLQFCRTEVLGGRRMECPRCRHQEIVFTSCGNRHCPKCQFHARETWLRKQQNDLLPVSYYHLVVTLPHDLNPWMEHNKVLLLNLFFRTVNRVMQAFAKDPQWRLEGQLGMLSVLHTWTQRLRIHYHLHNLVPAGVLQEDGTWKPSKKNFLFRKVSLGKSIRHAFLKALKRLWRQGKIRPPKNSQGEDRDLIPVIDTLKSKKWVLYLKKPFAGPETVLKYLGRYTHRVAISNHRIVSIDDDTVTFSYFDRHTETRKTRTLTGPEFIRRFLSHVLPRRFVKIRHFGFLASRFKSEKLALIRSQCPPPDELEATEILLQHDDFTEDPWQKDLCPACNSATMRVVEQLLRQPPSRHMFLDSS